MKTKRGSVLGITEGKGPFPVIQRIKIQLLSTEKGCDQ
jgi:hypothetical protein